MRNSFSSTVSRAALLCAAVVLLVAAVTDGAVPAPGTPAPSGRIIVKFREGVGPTLDDMDRMVGGGDKASITALLDEIAPGARLERRFKRPAADLADERAEGMRRTGRDLPDLTAWAEFDACIGVGDPAALELIARHLRAHPAVETAFPEPRMVPAALGFDAWTGRYTPPDHPVTPPSADKVTPDYTSLQGYKDNVQGVHALAVVGQLGADGAGVKVIDIEGAWKWDHEDLTTPFHESGGQYADQSWRDHGTAVIGEIRGSDNGFGITGITPACDVGAASIAVQSLPNALSTATAAMGPGDVILIELHAPGPNANGSGQFGYVPMEYWQDNFDAIVAATAAGRIVVEAAGNGQQDLDDPVYGSLFDPLFRHSGAIMVGAGDAASNPEWFTNHGVRVDVNGWGSNVVTCGYGDLQGGPETEWYTQFFGGTSSASPIVVGSVVSVQGMAKAQLGTVLDAALMRDILVDTGTPQVPDPWLIGPRPNIEAAWAVAQAGLGVVEGVVTDAGTTLPIEGVLVEIVGEDRSTLTDAAGFYTLGMVAGPATLDFSEYFHIDDSASLTVVAETTTIQNMALTALPTVTVAGTVTGTVAFPITNARITPVGTPLAGTIAAGDGTWSIPGVPVGKVMDMIVDNAPFFGADWASVVPHDPGGGVYPVHHELRFTTQSFASSGGWTAIGTGWAHGTPTTGPSAAWSSPACWGVGMNANYDDDAAGFVASPSQTIWTGDFLHLSVHYWSRMEAGWDGVQLRIKDGVSWVALEPVGGYPYAALPGLDDKPGWSGDSGGWRGAVFDVSHMIGQQIELSFLFGSDEAVNDEGFFVDDVTFDNGNTIVSVDDLPAADGTLTVDAAPNPFNPSTSVRWNAPTAGRWEVRVHDARGRLVRSLFHGEAPAGRNVVDWNGRDDAGRSAPSGVYLVQVRDALGGVATARLTLVK